MSDALRKDTSTKVKETIHPDAQKSTADKVKETVTDTADRTAREGQTDSSKSGTQGLMDKTERSKDDVKHGGTGESVGDKIKSAVGMDTKKTSS